MASLDYQMIRQAVREEFANILGSPDEEEGCPEKCYDVEELEAIVVAMIKSLRERIDAQDKRIAEFEKRPVEESWEDNFTKILKGPYQSCSGNTITLPNGTQFSWTY